MDIRKGSQDTGENSRTKGAFRLSRSCKGDITILEVLTTANDCQSHTGLLAIETVKKTRHIVSHGS